MSDTESLGRTQQILDAIYRMYLTTGRSPTFREVSAITLIPRTTLNRELERMRQEGLITWTRHRRKTLVLTREGVHLYESLGATPF